MLRNIIAILAGIIAGLISIALIEYLGQELFPTPANLVLDEELYNSDKAYEMIPLPAMLMVLLAYSSALLLQDLPALPLANANRWPWFPDLYCCLAD